jgi:hypothetical protein
MRLLSERRLILATKEDGAEPSPRRRGRPPKDKKAPSASRTVRVPNDMYDEMIAYLARQTKRHGRSLTLGSLLWNAWLAFQDLCEPEDFSLITGPRRRIMVRLVHFLATADAKHPGQAGIENILSTADSLLNLCDRIARMKRR